MLDDEDYHNRANAAESLKGYPKMQHYYFPYPDWSLIKKKLFEVAINDRNAFVRLEAADAWGEYKCFVKKRSLKEEVKITKIFLQSLSSPEEHIRRLAKEYAWGIGAIPGVFEDSYFSIGDTECNKRLPMHRIYLNPFMIPLLIRLVYYQGIHGIEYLFMSILALIVYVVFGYVAFYIFFKKK